MSVTIEQQTESRPAHWRKPGQAPVSPGRPKGSYKGRIRALVVLDKMLETEQNLQALRQSLQALFTKNPARFFEKFIMPLLPHETKIQLDAEGVIAWRSFLTTSPTPPSDSSDLPPEGPLRS